MNQRYKENLKLAGLEGSDSGALTQSGDETEESSPSYDPFRPSTEVGAEAGEMDVEMAERLTFITWWVSHTIASGSVCCCARVLTPRTAQNLRQCQKPRKPRKLPREAHLRVFFRIRLLYPPEPPRNESGRLVWRFRTVYGILARRIVAYPFFRALISPRFVLIFRVSFLRAPMVSEPRYPVGKTLARF